ncbi:MAG: GNAT family N-acetyltransferase [Lachnospiraceae bacterium]|nr:GNAT family N-acetyltransferase [Lachnospiraceae bacterium]
MKLTKVMDKRGQKAFIRFRKELYKRNPVYVDNNLFMLKEVFARKTSFTENKQISVINVEKDETVVCQGIIVYAKDLKDYIQLCFFESLPEQHEAVRLLVEEAIRVGKKYGCKKLVIGLNGHVNYGLGFLNSHFDTINSFSAAANPEYYNAYFKELGCEEIHLNSYRMNTLDERIHKYDPLIRKLNKNYTFRTFDKKEFKKYAQIYTDLNNRSFNNHRYYYTRREKEDIEMLKELFLFMKPDSLIFAFDGDTPVGFIMWYPDFNELVKPGDYFGAKHYIKNKLFGSRIRKIKVMEYGVLPEYRKTGLPLGLLNKVFEIVKRRGFTSVESSWILEENRDSNSFCEAMCDQLYKRYVVYEKEIC